MLSLFDEQKGITVHGLGIIRENLNGIAQFFYCGENIHGHSLGCGACLDGMFA